MTEQELAHWATAAAAVLFSAANLCVVHGFHIKTMALYGEVQGGNHAKNSSHLQICYGAHGQNPSPTHQALLIIYCFVIAVSMMSTPMEYIPEFGSATGPIKQIYSLVAATKYSTGLLLHVISNLLIPYCAQKLAGSSAVARMIFAQLVIN